MPTNIFEFVRWLNNNDTLFDEYITAVAQSLQCSKEAAFENLMMRLKKGENPFHLVFPFSTSDPNKWPVLAHMWKIEKEEKGGTQ